MNDMKELELTIYKLVHAYLISQGVGEQSAYMKATSAAVTVTNAVGRFLIKVGK